MKKDLTQKIVNWCGGIAFTVASLFSGGCYDEMIRYHAQDAETARQATAINSIANIVGEAEQYNRNMNISGTGASQTNVYVNGGGMQNNSSQEIIGDYAIVTDVYGNSEKVFWGPGGIANYLEANKERYERGYYADFYSDGKNVSSSYSGEFDRAKSGTYCIIRDINLNMEKVFIEGPELRNYTGQNPNRYSKGYYADVYENDKWIGGTYHGEFDDYWKAVDIDGKISFVRRNNN